jgi:alpha-ribazole phosphatase
MRLYLLRHGKTDANERRLYCGSADIPMSESGAAELRSLKSQIVYPKADIYVCSGLLRTAQTIGAIYGEEDFLIINELRELAFGEFEMRGYEELKGVQAYQDWINSIETNAPPGGENKTAFVSRVLRGYEKLLRLCESQYADSAAAVTHGGVIAVLMDYLFPGVKNFYEWQPACGRGYEVTYDKATGDIGWLYI